VSPKELVERHRDMVRQTLVLYRAGAS